MLQDSALYDSDALHELTTAPRSISYVYHKTSRAGRGGMNNEHDANQNLSDSNGLLLLLVLADAVRYHDCSLAEASSYPSGRSRNADAN